MVTYELIMLILKQFENISKFSFHLLFVLIKVIDPIVPQEFGFTSKDKFSNNSTEFMSDSSSDASSDSDSNMT